MRIIEADTQNALPLGRQGEKGVTTVAFDVHGWLEEFGAGTFVLLHKRNGDDAGYPVKTVLEDGKVLWTVDEADVFRPGTGVAQLIMMVDGKVAKSGLYKTSTSQALNETKTAPEAWKAWVDSIFEAVGTYPRINTIGNWEVFDGGAWKDTGVSAKGKVPVKGVDYFDGKDGHTPVMTGSKEGKTNTVYADGVPLINVQDCEGGVQDVQINGTSIVADGVASIPDADEGKRGVFRSSVFYGTSIYNGILMPVYHDAQQYSTDPNNFFVGKGTLNNVLSTPSIMPALTDSEKAEARKRIGLGGDWKLIADTTITESVHLIEFTTFSDGSPLSTYEFFLLMSNTDKVGAMHPLTIGVVDANGTETTVFGTNNITSTEFRVYVNYLGNGNFISHFTQSPNTFNSNSMTQISTFTINEPFKRVTLGGYIWDRAGNYGGLIANGTRIRFWGRKV